MDTLNTPSPAMRGAPHVIPTRSHRPWLLPLAAAVLVAVGASAGVLIGRHNAAPVAEAQPVAALAPEAQARGTSAETAPAKAAAKPQPRQQASAEPRHSGAESRTPLDTRPARAVEVCASCGVVESVQAQTRQGDGSGVGAVAGGVVGGLLGNQMGKGNGRTAMTVIGAIGGGMAGNEIEKRQRASTVYQVKVRMDDGTLRSFTRSEAWAVGQRVTVDGGGLQPSNEAMPAASPATSRDRMLQTGSMT